MTFQEKSDRIRRLRAEGKAEVSYEICIDEAQRAALAIVLGAFGSLPDALEYWPEMLADLPREEAETPGLLHGFCL